MKKRIMKKSVFKKKSALLIVAALVILAFPYGAEAKRASQSPVRIAGKVVEKGTDNALEFVTVAIRDTSDAVIAAITTDTTGTFSFTLTYKNGGNSINGGTCLTAEFALIGYVTARIPVVDILSAYSGNQMDRTSSSGMAVAGNLDGSAAGGAVIELVQDTQMLESAKVTGKRELLEHKFDKIVMNVSELAVAQTGNANDVLRSAPGVTIDKDGNIQLNGNTVSVWLDGRPSNMSGKELQSYLNGSAGTSIEKVEIISNPSSKYDAEGSGGIINIKTKREFMRGFNGSITADADLGWTPRVNGNANLGVRLGYKGNKTNTTLSYSPYGGTWNNDGLEEKRYGDDYTNFRSTETSSDSYWLGHHISLMHDWNISDKDVLGAIVRVGLSDGGVMNQDISESSEWHNVPVDNNNPSMSPYSHLKGTSANGRNSSNISANLNYTRKFDESKSQELTLNADYNRGGYNAWSWQKNTYTSFSEEAQAAGIADPSLFADNGRNDSTYRVANIYSLKADYSQNFWNQTGRIEAGFKAALSVTDNDYNYLSYGNRPSTDAGDAESGSGSVVNPEGILTGDNNFRYMEQIYAAYINVAKRFNEKWNAQIGLRGELTVPKGVWTSEDKVSGKPYFDVFPTAYLTYVPTPKAVLSVNYSYRLSRPKYWQLNPFRDYMNPYSYSTGNPEMLPSYTHSVALSGVFFSHLTLSVGYNSTLNHNEQQIAKTDEKGITEFKYDNSGTQRLAYVSLALSEQPITKWWTLTANMFYGYTAFTAYKKSVEEMGLADYKSSSHCFRFYGSTTFYLPKDFRISIDGWAMTPQAVSYYKVKAMGSLDFSVSKTFLDGRINLTLGMRDLLNSVCSDIVLNVNGVQTVRMKNVANGRLLNLGFTYSFGQASSSRRNVGNSEESSRL